MDLEVVQYLAGAIPESRLYQLRNADELRAVEDRLGAPTVWVVAIDQFPALQELGDAIEDRGTKHKARQLALILRKNGRIPMVNGDFRFAGKLEQGVFKYLERGGDSIPRLAIIGTDREMFAALQQKHPTPTAHLSQGPVNNVPDVSNETHFPHDPLCLFMTCRPVPRDLQRAYRGESLEVQMVRQLILLAGAVDAPVLITGDTGTGKEIVAKEIHNFSPRRMKPFRPVNCSAFPYNLLESELFGHKRGSFTDAVADKTGIWVEADGGTLFLDEIGDLAPDHQAKILRSLELNEVKPVGSTAVIKVNARVIAATNRDLFAMVQEGKFREDLYYRLRGFYIHTPALRDHPEDIPTIARATWEEIAGSKGPNLGEDLVSMLEAYAWPGNVRELKMVLTFLYGLFRTQDMLHTPHLHAAWNLLGINVKRNEVSAGIEETGTTTILAIRHLQRIYEVIRAVEHAMVQVKEGLMIGREPAEIHAGQLTFLCGELEQLCRKPALFTPETFDSVNLFRSRLSYFVAGLKEDPAVAAATWSRQGETAVGSTVVAVLGEMENLLGKLQGVE